MRSLASNTAEVAGTEDLDEATAFTNLKILSKVRTSPFLSWH